MQLGEKTWKEAAELTDKIVVVPLGSHEQHGHHLPLLTDSMIGSEITRRAQARLKGEALFLPMLWLGCSPHHLDFPGTISVSSEIYIRLIEEVTQSLIGSGFRRILFFNAHAGNMTPTSAAINNVQMRYASTLPDLWLLSASWFVLAAQEIGGLKDLKQSKISHACEWETSQILAIQPDLVKQERPAARFSFEVAGQSSLFYNADYSQPSRVEVARRIEQNSQTGAFGWPELASVEKGEQLLEAASRELVKLVQEFSNWPREITPQLTDGKQGVTSE